jgi:zona occludens toxin (predicted ATPase)
MMSTKNKIYTAVMVVAFGITGYMLYSSFSSKPAATVPTVATQQATTNIGIIPGSTALPAGSAPAALNPVGSAGGAVNILPLGNKFDTSIVKQLNTQFNVFNYPKVTPEAVGVTSSNLIKSQVETTQK